MTRTQAIKKIEKFIANSQPKLIVPSYYTYDAYIKFLSDKLLNEVIDSVRVKVTSTIIQDADFDKYCDAEVWGITKGEGGWLLTIDGLDEFALGFGDDIRSIKMHGCSSNNVLEEWYA